MNLIKIISILSFLGINFQVFSQNTIVGNVKDVNNLPITDVVVELSNEKTRKITNKKGEFNFKKTDTLGVIFLDLYKIGYVPLRKKVDLKKIKSNQIDFIMINDKTITLDEVTIVSKKKINKSNKIIYKINSKDFIKNSKAQIALQTLPNVAITSSGVMVDNRKNAVIFIDGVESGVDELKRLDVKEVSKIEVISNPSASYGTELLGAVIHVITKKNYTKFFKGDFETFAGVRLNSYGVIPSLALKTKRITFGTFYSYNTNNQNIESDLSRVENNNIFNQYNYREVKGWQDYFSARLKTLLSSRSSFIVSGNLFRYQFNSLSNGFYSNNTTTNTNFNINSIEKLDKGFISAIYNFEINSTNNIFIKYKYFDYNIKNNYSYKENGDSSNNDIFSNIKESSTEFVYKKNEANIFKLPFDYSIGYKNIIRKFDFQPTNFNLNQSINNIFVDANIDFSDTFSIFTSVVTDFSNNKNETLNQNYIFILPTFSGLYKINKKINFTIDYSRKITRPNAEHLNEEEIFFNPSLILRGNTDLIPQLRNLYEIRISNQINKNTSVSINMYNENIKDAIIKTFIFENNNVITTYENAGNVNLYGVNIGLNTKIFKSINLNLNSGVKHNNYSSNTDNSLVKENKGYSFNTSLYLYSLINKKTSLSLIGSFNSPFFSLISERVTNPLLSIEAERTFLKDKLNVRLSYSDIFGLSTNSYKNISYTNFNQNSNISNRMTNFTISVIYNFGKYFNDRFSNPTINNDDIKTK